MGPWLLRPLAAGFLLAALAPCPVHAQDTTRARADTARPDTTRRADTLRVALDTAQLAQRVPIPPPAPLPLRIQLDLGVQAVGGNRSLTVFNTVVVIERRRKDDFLLSARLELRYGTSNGEEAANYQDAGVRFDWRPRELVSPFVGSDVTRDRVRLIGLRAQGGVGLNFNLDIREAGRTTVSGGLVFDHQEFLAGVAPSQADDTRWLLRAATTRLLGPSTRLEATAKIQPAFTDAGDYLAALNASVRVALNARVGLTTRLEVRRDTRPAPGVLPDDRSLSAGLSLTW